MLVVFPQNRANYGSLLLTQINADVLTRMNADFLIGVYHSFYPCAKNRAIPDKRGLEG